MTPGLTWRDGSISNPTEMFRNLKHKSTLLLLLIGIHLLAGQEASNQLLFPKQLLWTNPALVGIEQEKNIGLLIDSQWLGVKDAPKQQSLFFESSFENQKINFGALIRNRSRFAENSTQLFIQFAFPIQLTNDSYLHLGVQAGGDFYELNFEYLSSVDGVAKDPLLQKQLRFIPNTGVGFNLQKGSYFLTASLPRLLERYAFEKVPDLFLPNRLYFTMSVGKNFYRLSGRKEFELGLQFHNLDFDKRTVQLKGSYHLPIGALFMGVNTAKNLGLGFQLYSRGILNLAYAFEFPFQNSTRLRQNNHSLMLQLKFLKKPHR